jgi:hypothetical protein
VGSNVGAQLSEAQLSVGSNVGAQLSQAQLSQAQLSLHPFFADRALRKIKISQERDNNLSSDLRTNSSNTCLYNIYKN